MAGATVAALLMSAALRPAVAIYGDICGPGKPSEGGCTLDGTNCEGTTVEFMPYAMPVSRWDAQTNQSKSYGHITAYTIFGHKDTWQMYLHGPHIHAREMTDKYHLPPVYVFATFTNQVYRFDNFSRLSPDGTQPLRATQKVVGRALAPSTGYIFEDPHTHLAKSMLVAEGQPFLLSNIDTVPPHEMNLGGVQSMPAAPPGGDQTYCSTLFPVDFWDPMHRMTGQVVNTVDCHEGTGVCFFSVWVFYDDQKPLWNKITENMLNDCLYYCILDRDHTDSPRCIKTAVVVDEHGEPICHKDGVGAVHGFEVGNTDPKDPMKFDLLLVFTGKATMDNGESSMKKVTVQVTEERNFPFLRKTRDLKVLHSAPFAEDLFDAYAPKGYDVGGDHAWVDATGKFVWVSCFRSKGVGVHMLDYESGELLYSVTGISDYVPKQYTYTAGINGVGTLGQKGSYLVVATCSCHDLAVCIPTMPWSFPVPEDVWSTGVLFIIDLSTMTPKLETIQV